jgi:restriction system protein
VLHNRIHWAKFYMSKAGLIESPARGLFVASEAGKALLATKPVAIDVEMLKAYPPFVDFYSAKPAEGAAPDFQHRRQPRSRPPRRRSKSRQRRPSCILHSRQNSSNAFLGKAQRFSSA